MQDDDFANPLSRELTFSEASQEAYDSGSSVVSEASQEELMPDVTAPDVTSVVGLAYNSRTSPFNEHPAPFI